MGATGRLPHVPTRFRQYASRVSGWSALELRGEHGRAQPVLPVQEKPPAFSFCRFAGAYRWSASFAPSPR